MWRKSFSETNLFQLVRESLNFEEPSADCSCCKQTILEKQKLWMSWCETFVESVRAFLILPELRSDFKLSHGGTLASAIKPNELFQAKCLIFKPVLLF